MEVRQHSREQEKRAASEAAASIRNGFEKRKLGEKREAEVMLESNGKGKE